MQNKPNFRKSQMNVSIFSKMDYENKSNWTLGENKPNSNPIKPNQTQFPKSPNECNLTYNKGLQKIRWFRSPKKQTQFKPNLLDAQMNATSFITKDYENERLCRRGENKPNQTQFAGCSNERNFFYNKGIWKWTTSQTRGKQTQSNPISKAHCGEMDGANLRFARNDNLFVRDSKLNWAGGS